MVIKDWNNNFYQNIFRDGFFKPTFIQNHKFSSVKHFNLLRFALSKILQFSKIFDNLNIDQYWCDYLQENNQVRQSRS